MTKRNIEIWTDGSFSSSRSQMGIGILILDSDTEEVLKEISHGYKGGTNNKAEIAAVIIALRCIKEGCNSIVINTDSMLVIGQLSKNWKRNKNIALLKEADKELKRVSKLCPDIQFNHVDGHSGIKYNERVDALAVKGSKLILE